MRSRVAVSADALMLIESRNDMLSPPSVLRRAEGVAPYAF